MAIDIHTHVVPFDFPPYAGSTAAGKWPAMGPEIEGVPSGDSRLEPFSEAAEALGASIFVHPLHPAGLDRLVGPPALVQLLAFPGETALSVGSLITGGVLERHRRLRIAISHGGGGFSPTPPRLIFRWSPNRTAPSRPTPPQNAPSLYLD